MFSRLSPMLGRGREEGEAPHMSFIGMCRPKGYGVFSSRSTMVLALLAFCLKLSGIFANWSEIGYTCLHFGLKTAKLSTCNWVVKITYFGLKTSKVHPAQIFVESPQLLPGFNE